MDRNRFSLFLRGAAMGAADIVPGVSGGTVAFITGIYEELLSSLAGLSPAKLLLIKDKGFATFWLEINGAFLLTLFTGILLSVFSLAKIISFLLVTWPLFVWSFFFGLIVASVHLVGKGVKRWGRAAIFGLLIGVVFAYSVTLLSPTSIEATGITVFGAGFIAISAMILPGISGSFILVLLGMYQEVLLAVKSLDIPVLAMFALGCVCGLMVMSRVLTWAFRKYHDLTLAILTGVMLGALNKVWPWKETLSWRVNSHGVEVPLEQESVFPATYEVVTNLPSELSGSILFMVLGVALVLFVEFLGRRQH